MILWLDAHLSPRIARWITDVFGLKAVPVRDLGLRDAGDQEIFSAARTANVVVITKDSDFVERLERLGSPPKIIWLTCGNTSEAALQELLASTLSEAMRLLDAGDDLVEISRR